MNIHVISSFFFVCNSLLLAVLTLLKRRDETAKRWLYFSLLIAAWGVHYAFLANNDISSETALWITRWGNACAGFIPAAWLYFICGFLRITRRKTMTIAWLVAFVIALMAPSPKFIPRVVPVKEFVHYADWGILFIIHALNFVIFVSYDFFLLWQAYRAEKDQDRKREIFSIFFAHAVAFISGGSTFSLVFFKEKGIDLSLFIGIYPFLMAYAMIKHRALDIEKIADAFQREKLAAIGILAASVNHELKSPLFVIRGALDSCFKKLKSQELSQEKKIEAAVNAVEKSVSQIDRATQIMQRLTDFAKPGSEQTSLKNVSVAEILNRVLELVHSQFVFHKIKLIKEIDQNLIVHVDSRQMEQILFNLIVNACQAMPQGGDLFVGARQKDGGVQIEIRDSGLGISSTDEGRIFEPFYSTKGKEGTGLGLYITKQLVERNGGKLWFDTSSQGTSFFIEFS